MILFLRDLLTNISIIVIPPLFIFLLLGINTFPNAFIFIMMFIVMWWVAMYIFLKEFSENLNSIYSPYPFIRKRIAQKLSQVPSPESVTTLANAVKSSDDQAVIKIAISTLSQLRSQEAIDALYKVWEKTKYKDLTAILKNRRYVATEINLRVLFALKIGALDILKAKTEDILEFLLLAIDDPDTQIASAANTCITELTNRKTIDLICRQWIEYPNPRLQAIIQQGNYEPNDASIKALFYFLLGEWKKYEDLDFDQSLLAKAYQCASKEIQTRVGEKATTEGRIEWVKIMTSNKRGYAIEKITEMDWQSFIDILESQPDRKEVWKFLYNAPAIWSKKLLDKLVKRSASWLMKDDKIRLNSLFGMVENLKDQDFILFKSSEDQDLDFLVSPESQEIIPKVRRGYYTQFLDEHTFASTKTNSKDIDLWNLPHGNYLRSITNHWNHVYDKYGLGNSGDIDISADGRVLALCISKKSEYGGLPESILCLSSFPDAKHLIDITGSEFDIGLIRIDSNRKIIVSAYNGDINFWSLSNGSHLKTIKTKTRITSIEISSDGYILATTDSTTSTDLWSLPDGNLLKTFPIRGRELTMSPDGKVLAIYGNPSFSSHDIHLLSLPDGNEMESLKGHTNSVCSVAITPNGKILASGSLDGTIRLWSLPDGKHLKTIKGHTDTGGYSVAINQNGRVLVSNSSDGTMRLWTSPNIPISKLTPIDIAEIERKVKDSSLGEGTRNAFKFTLALIRLRRQFDIDIEDISSDVQFSEFDIEIDG